MNSEKTVYENYPLLLAGRTWIFEKVVFVRDLEGDISLSFAELDRMHRAVANALCQEESELKKEEAEFLCELTSSSWQEIAEFLYCDPSTVSKWRKRKSLPKLESICLKSFFWEKLFGHLSKEQTLGSLNKLKMASAAIESKLSLKVNSKTVA